jgi:hypothetical protein
LRPCARQCWCACHALPLQPRENRTRAPTATTTATARRTNDTRKPTLNPLTSSRHAVSTSPARRTGRPHQFKIRSAPYVGTSDDTSRPARSAGVKPNRPPMRAIVSAQSHMIRQYGDVTIVSLGLHRPRAPDPCAAADPGAAGGAQGRHAHAGRGAARHRAAPPMSAAAMSSSTLWGGATTPTRCRTTGLPRVRRRV